MVVLVLVREVMVRLSRVLFGESQKLWRFLWKWSCKCCGGGWLGMESYEVKLRHCCCS
jgi:hypothetical protein